MVDLQRNIFIIALLIVSFVLWQEWQKDVLILNSTIDTQKDLHCDTSHNLNHTNKYIHNKQGKLITVKTDVLSLYINTYGGNVEEAFLLTYFKTVDSSDPVHFLQNSQNYVYQAQSGLIGKNGVDNVHKKNRPLYFSQKDHYILEKSANVLYVPLIYINSEGIIYKKIFVLHRNSFAVKVYYKINNITDYPLELILYGQIQQSISPPSKNSNILDSSLLYRTYRGVAYSCCQNKYIKYSFEDIKKDNIYINTKEGWIAMLQKYFVTAWIPKTSGNNMFYIKYSPNHEQIIAGFRSSSIIVYPGNQNVLESILWIGPEIQDSMRVVAPNLDFTVDYGWLWFISQPLLKLLQFIHGYVKNWGFAIIIITFILRGIMYPLTKMQYMSIAKIRILQPEIAKIREKFHDKIRQSQEIMLLYKEKKINPLCSFFPLLIQMPIFLGLYYMLSDSIELRHAHFILWINDLSEKDAYYILPILMGLTMFIIQKFFPSAHTIDDPIQKKIMVFVPIIFTIFFLWFPSGLVLYYIVSNFVTIIQQKFIYRELEKIGLNI
ncbi:MAG: membrane protein insertase YidC [Candidatus Westeberhardia cardiocondylae]|nr:membrane protein insertase YidC [Candidatus Westeberhardia cardiocondylae]